MADAAAADLVVANARCVATLDDDRREIGPKIDQLVDRRRVHRNQVAELGR